MPQQWHSLATAEQHLALQVDALRKAGCRKVYEEIISGACVEIPVLQDMLTRLAQATS